ncbi:MAG: FAD-binding oxidoreductase [Gemmatimonadetes bacterium]|jgi:glycine oxidase|nr:FAD-binding oxidoreductase [Gemmatimonadota bacterium]MBT6149076.1 FAD-binding oxidoreductase [Gemmatimonadota bacterium]MBT7862606.1 FAD-binding oxidoreductase [Gemmatimonadota bacterium]
MPVSCIILGAGLVGRSLAYYLTRSDIDVTLVDADDPAHSVSPTTRASLGALTRPNTSADSLSRFYRLSHELHRPLAEQLAEETGVDVGWRPCGGLDVAYDEAAVRYLRDRGTRLLERGARGEWLTAAQVAEHAPALRPGILDACWWRDDHQVDTVQLSRALWMGAHQEGATYRQGSALRIETGPAVILGGGERLEADVVVIAAGARSAGLLADLGVTPTPVRSIPGQSLRLRTAADLPMIVHWQDVHMLRAGKDTLSIGATVEEPADTAEPTPAAREHLLARARWLLGQDDLIVETHVAGLRPKPRRGRPLIAALPSPGLFVATGHYKSGALMAPLTGQVVARWIVDGDPRIDLAPFSIDR